jgi:hypothetical protein
MTTNWVYLQSEPGLFTVGFYDPSGKWRPHADFSSRDEAVREVIRLTHGAVDPSSVELRLLRKENEELHRKVEELETASAFHDCMAFFEKPVDVCVSPDDDRFTEAPEVLCRVVRYHDRGDPSVGIWPTDMLVLADDQKGTWIDLLLRHKVPTETEMIQEFEAWKVRCGISSVGGDAQEMLNWVLSWDQPNREMVRWLEDFVARWEQASRSWADDRSSLQAEKRSV